MIGYFLIVRNKLINEINILILWCSILQAFKVKKYEQQISATCNATSLHVLPHTSNIVTQRNFVVANWSSMLQQVELASTFFNKSFQFATTKFCCVTMFEVGGNTCNNAFQLATSQCYVASWRKMLPVLPGHDYNIHIFYAVQVLQRDIGLMQSEWQNAPHWRHFVIGFSIQEHWKAKGLLFTTTTFWSAALVTFAFLAVVLAVCFSVGRTSSENATPVSEKRFDVFFGSSLFLASETPAKTLACHSFSVLSNFS